MAMVGEKHQRRGQETPVSITGAILNVTNGGRRAAEGQNPQNHGGESSSPSPSHQRGGEKGPHPPERKEGGQAVPKAARACQGPCCGDSNCNAAWPELISCKEQRQLESPCKRAQR